MAVDLLLRKESASAKRRKRRRRLLARRNPDWLQLPEPAIRLVALLAGGKDALNFCATCRAFRAAQPPLRCLVLAPCNVIARHCEEKIRSETMLRGGLWIIILKGQKPGVHYLRVIECLPTRYAGHITHLFLDDSWDTRKLSLHGRLVDYGRNLTALHSLHLAYAPRDCAVQLVRATRKTLRVLSILGDTYHDQFRARDAEVLLTKIGLVKLHSLALLIAKPVFASPACKLTYECETLAIRKLAWETCTDLKEPAIIACHFSLYPPWFFESWQLFDPNEFWGHRNEFLDRHQCIEWDETDDEDADWYRPKGYRGKWCGFTRKCQCNDEPVTLDYLDKHVGRLRAVPLHPAPGVAFTWK